MSWNSDYQLTEYAWDEILGMAESVWEDDLNEAGLADDEYEALDGRIWEILKDPAKFKDAL